MFDPTEYVATKVVFKYRSRKFSVPTLIIGKLDRVGHIDNRPSTNWLHHFVQ